MKLHNLSEIGFRRRAWVTNGNGKEDSKGWTRGRREESSHVDILEMATADNFSLLGRRERRVGDLFDKWTSWQLLLFPLLMDLASTRKAPLHANKSAWGKRALSFRHVRKPHRLGILCRRPTCLGLIYPSDMSAGESE